MESAGGLLLALAAFVAMLCANSVLSEPYFAALERSYSIGAGEYLLSKTLLHWINDGLMAIFFLLIGLEIKREMVQGELSSVSKAVLPAMAALGGMAAPALIYALFNGANPETIRGWAIPSATDIAFSLGVLSILGSRVPLALKVFLTAVAVFDDLGAIIIIALFYAQELSLLSLTVASVCAAILFAMNRLGVMRLPFYLLIGTVMWLAVLKSGVHATIAGVVLGLMIPLAKEGVSPLKILEHRLHPWVAFMILPVFAFANAGVPLGGVTAQNLFEPVTLGVALGLLLGKPIGIFGSSWLLIRSGFAKLPAGVDWVQLLGISMIAGIGFTMSLFIGGLAFQYSDPAYFMEVKIGVIIGSLLSAVAGYMLLAFALKRRS